MYKVLLVDDENWVIKSLEAGVDWPKSGFRVAGKANNGSRALQLVQELKPHIVFTDIRMPGMSGLELIKKIKEFDNDIQVVVISGYAEFAYVQKSLNYGVLGYCLKPFDDYEIDALLRSAAKIIEEINMKRESHLLDLMDHWPSEMSETAFDRILADVGLIADTVHVVVSVGKGRLAFPEGTKAIGIHLGSSRCGYFVQFPVPANADETLFETIPESIVGIGVVRSDRRMNELMKHIELATTCAWDFFIHGRICRQEEAQEDETMNEAANSLVRNLEIAVAKKEPSLVRAHLDEMRLPTNKRNLRIHHALKIYNIVYFHDSYDRRNSSVDDYIFSKDQLYHLYHNFDQMIECLKELLSESDTSSALPTERATEHANLKEIVKYMNEHYRGDISIQSISKIFFLNPNYLSQLFKRELKVTFTEYLTKIRLQEAKHLLSATGLSIGEVADGVGFKDYFYFIRLFKKHTLQTPRQYRFKDKHGEINPESGRRAEEKA
ncbi:response regulator [Cohnella endophytica]|uniref:Response regulator n=1 Tax=Cohnella endophytica TaxID=2419778 RepID=A0A494X974_9BACL|nr:response regulator [Cohnella endophytica]RKP46772.1 response regulator [Cohnella endophytica]